ncbi:MAG: DUF1449 family protein [Myxococcales bacterium]
MIAFLSTLFTWANAPYTTALLAVALYVGLQLLGFLAFGSHEQVEGAGGQGADAEAHADLDGDADAEVHADLDAHADADADADADTDTDTDGDLDGEGEAESDAHADGHDAGHIGHASSPLGALASALGVGKVPLGVIWQTVFTLFGLIGITATTLVHVFTGSLSAGWLAVTFPLAAVLGTVSSGFLVRLVARLVPSSSGEASRRRDLVGCTGVVISSKVDAEFGEVRLTDPQGRTLRLICRVHPRAPPIPEGSEVVVTDIEEGKQWLYVAATSKLLEEKS